MNIKDTYLIIVVIVVVVIAGLIGYYAIYGENQNTITIAGSTTVAPVATALANAYMQEHPDAHITVAGGDSAYGINNVRSGSVNIGTSSRNLNSSEAEGLSQYIIGTDAIAIIVNDQNPVNATTTTQLAGIFAGTVNNWSDLGGNDAPITPITREKGSGTRADFEQMVLGITNGGFIANNTVTSSSTYDELQYVATSPNAIGYVARNALQTQVKVLSVNGFIPDQTDVQNGNYPLKRNMIFLIKGKPTGLTEDFINFSLSAQGQAIINSVEYNNTASNTNAQNPGIAPSGAG